MKLPPSRGRGPWAIASFIAIPLFFSSLMASALAQEKPRVVQWKGGKHGLLTTWHEPSSSTEARVWLWAIVPALVLSLIGYACMRIPYGWYIACTAGIVESLAVVHRLDTWTAHHQARFPWGVDLIPATNFQSDQYDPGEWERLARETAISLSHWTIGLALASMLVMSGLWVRRTYFTRKSLFADGPEPLPGVHAPDSTLPAD